MFSAEFKIALLREVFKDNSAFDSLHDVVNMVTNKSYSETELASIFLDLPELIQADALKWGVGDTEVGDQIYVHLQKRK